jgi:putative oxidoreductase
LSGGLSVLLEVKPKLAAAVILGFLAGISPSTHDFWKAEQADQRINDTVNFMKNMALAGGATALMAVEEPWPASVPITRKPARGLRRLLRKVAA